jgi:hypothetical protein
MAEEVGAVARHHEMRKQPGYLRKALEQLPKEGCTFTSFGSCETTEEMVAGARHDEMRNELA